MDKSKNLYSTDSKSPLFKKGNQLTEIIWTVTLTADKIFTNQLSEIQD